VTATASGDPSLRTLGAMEPPDAPATEPRAADSGWSAADLAAIRRSRRLVVSGLVVFGVSLALPAVDTGSGSGDFGPRHVFGALCLVFFPPTYVTNAFLLASYPLWHTAAHLRSTGARRVGRVAGVLSVLGHVAAGVWLVVQDATPLIGYFAWLAATGLVAAAFLKLPRAVGGRVLPPGAQDRGLLGLSWSLACLGTVGLVASRLFAFAGSAGSVDGAYVLLAIGSAVLIFVAAARTRRPGWIWTGAALAALLGAHGLLEAPPAGALGADWQFGAGKALFFHGPPAILLVAFLLLPRPDARAVG
jgi:hypothetical protein